LGECLQGVGKDLDAGKIPLVLVPPAIDRSRIGDRVGSGKVGLSRQVVHVILAA
jgi:hypothetical protein